MVRLEQLEPSRGGERLIVSVDDGGQAVASRGGAERRAVLDAPACRRLRLLLDEDAMARFGATVGVGAPAWRLRVGRVAVLLLAPTVEAPSRAAIDALPAAARGRVAALWRLGEALLGDEAAQATALEAFAASLPVEPLPIDTADLVLRFRIVEPRYHAADDQRWWSVFGDGRLVRFANATHTRAGDRTGEFRLPAADVDAIRHTLARIALPAAVDARGVETEDREISLSIQTPSPSGALSLGEFSWDFWHGGEARIRQCYGDRHPDIYALYRLLVPLRR